MNFWCCCQPSSGSVHRRLWSGNGPLYLRGYILLFSSPEQQGFRLGHFNDGESGYKAVVSFMSYLSGQSGFHSEFELIQ